MKRRLERKELREKVTFTNALTGDPAGHVVDITIEGVMIEANQPFDRQKVYLLNLQLPPAMAAPGPLRLGMDCLWARPADHFKGHWGGFQIIDASPEAIEQLQSLIDRYGI